MKPILILKTGETLPAIAREKGDFENWIISGTLIPPQQFETFPVYLETALPSLENYSAIIITGSPAMVTEEIEWIKQSEMLVLKAVDRGLPVLGICFGHQLIAQALGGKVDWHPRGREIGTTSVQLNADAASDILLKNLPNEIPAHVTHMQSVITLPRGAVILGSNAFDLHQAVRYAPRVWGLQFHPEFNEEIMEGYIRERFEDIRKEGLDPEKLLAQVSPASESQGILARFSELANNREQAG